MCVFITTKNEFKYGKAIKLSEHVKVILVFHDISFCYIWCDYTLKKRNFKFIN